jgi:hypothetical protein
MMFRREGLSLAPWYATLALFWLLSATFVVAFFVGIIDVGRLKYHDLYVIVLIGFMAFPPALFAWSLGKWIRLTRNNYIRTAEDGVHLRVSNADELTIAWNEIQAVTRDKRWVKLKGPFPFAYQNYFFTIVTARGRFAFTSMDIPSPARAAAEIAAKVGMEVQRITAGKAPQ